MPIAPPQGFPGRGIQSIDGVENPRGNVDLIGGTNIGITPDDANDQITLAVNEGWQLVTRLTDNDGATALSLDTGVLATTFDMYMVVVDVTDQSGADQRVSMRVNGITTASDYRFVTIEANLDPQDRSDSSWRLFTLESATIGAYFWGTILGNSEGGNVEAKMVGGGAPGNTVNSAFVRGRVETGQAQIDQINVFSASNATGRMTVFGMNF